MLKIPKGLKKKKKDKKHKRKDDQELFNEEELERYRKEHQQATVAGGNSAADNNAGSASSADKSDEWKKFNLLTAGVDTILQKTQEDLDRIKSTSYFQRKAPAPPAPTAKDKQKKDSEQPSSKQKSQVQVEDEGKLKDQHSEAEEEDKVVEPQDKEEEDEEEEFGDDDGIFETSYVDAVASGELKLAYIPDSPDKEEEDFDPFDTSIANKFISSNPKKRYLNLGCAVQVLSGKAATSSTSVVERRTPKRRLKPADLLLTSFDESSPVPAEADITDSPVKKTLLDDDPELESDPTILPAPAALPVPAPDTAVAPPPPAPSVHNLDLSEFEAGIVTAAPSISAQQSVESVDEEFEKLAAESLAKTEEVRRPSSIDLLTNRGLASPSGGHPSPIAAHTTVKEEDPFDTSVAEKHLLPGKREIALIEQEFLKPPHVQLSQLEDDDFDPRAESPPLPQADLLAENPVEESSVKPLTPIATRTSTSEESAEPDDENYDPFDTSHVSGAPGQSELKFIEKELQAPGYHQPLATNITNIIFDKYNITEKPAAPAEAQYHDILTGDERTEEEFVPSVQPENLADLEDDESYINPFDTSFADHVIAPGKTELKILENEFIN